MTTNNNNNKSNAIFYSKINAKKETKDMLILILNTIMYAERQAYLQEEEKNPNNKANGYRHVSVRAEGGRRIILAIPRDRLKIFKPYLIDVLKSEDPNVYTLCSQLYHSGFAEGKIKKLFAQIYTPKYAPKTITTMIRIFKKQLKNKLKS